MMIYWSENLAQSEVGFILQHRIISNIKLKLKEFILEVICNREDFNNAKITFKANPVSFEFDKLSTKDTNHSYDIFNLTLGKEISFTSTKLSKTEYEFIYQLDGMLTLNDVVKPISLSAMFGGKSKDKEGHEKCAFKLTGNINRKDWLIDWYLGIDNEPIEFFDEVLIDCKIQLIKSNVVAEVFPSILEKKEIPDDMRFSL